MADVKPGDFVRITITEPFDDWEVRLNQSYGIVMKLCSSIPCAQVLVMRKIVTLCFEQLTIV